MYLKFYHLKEIPFNLEPNLKYIPAVPNTKLVFSEILASIHQKNNFIVVLGDRGSGKTTIIKGLIERLSVNYRIKVLLEPGESSYEFVEEYYNLCELTKTDDSRDDLFSQHQSRIKQILKYGGNSILILDDAHLLPRGIFDLIQLFLKNKIKIILFGQNELKEKLQNPEYGNLWYDLKKYIFLHNLNYDEIRYYIKHRLSVARQNDNFENPFSEEAVEAIFRYSNGLPRRINILCNNALVIGFLQSVKTIDREIIEKVKTDDVCLHEIKKILHQTKN